MTIPPREISKDIDRFYALIDKSKFANITKVAINYSFCLGPVIFVNIIF